MKQKSAKQKIAQFLQFKGWDYYDKKWVEGWQGVLTVRRYAEEAKLWGQGWVVDHGDGDDFELRLTVQGEYITSAVIPATIEFDNRDFYDSLEAFNYCIFHHGHSDELLWNSISYIDDFVTIEKSTRIGDEIVIEAQKNTLHLYAYKLLQWLANF